MVTEENKPLSENPENSQEENVRDAEKQVSVSESPENEGDEEGPEKSELAPSVVEKSAKVEQKDKGKTKATLKQPAEENEEDQSSPEEPQKEKKPDSDLSKLASDQSDKPKIATDPPAAEPEELLDAGKIEEKVEVEKTNDTSSVIATDESSEKSDTSLDVAALDEAAVKEDKVGVASKEPSEKKEEVQPLVEEIQNAEKLNTEKSESEPEITASVLSEKGDVEKGEKTTDTSSEIDPDNLTDKPDDSSKVPPVGLNPEQEKGEVKEKKDAAKDSTDHLDHPAEATETHEVEEHHLDYSQYSKKQLVQVLESMLKDDDFSHIGKVLKEIKPAYADLFHHEKQQAYKRYIDEGGEKDGFEYKDDELDTQFHKDYDALKERRNEYYNSLEKQREDNLKRKQDLLEKLRHMVDAEETTASISELKKIQDEWRNHGSVAPQHMKSLWANYNALLDRYYDNRSIYFELKELDRKKNLALKLEICDKAEKLASIENIKDAIKELNEYHEEFKVIGPVPKEDQEVIWQRFKAASDEVYSRRKDYFEHLREKLKLNLLAKQALVEKVQPFVDFNSERISDWNSKTKEILQLQKEWETVGGLPKEKAKKINKTFWSTFKTFFNHKGLFFKRLEETRKENLEKKEALLIKAEGLKDSEDFIKTADALKALQQEWKDVGPVPEKQKDEIYKKFKAACDTFFNRRRENKDQIEHDYVDNLKKKEALCEELDQMEKGMAEIDRINAIQDEYDQIGFVPKNAMRTIQKRFATAIADALDQTNLEESEKHKLKFKAQFKKMKYGPNSDQFLQKKENAIRRQISKLENDISLWKNNMDFFADSKNADKVKDEFNKKIQIAATELEELKEQLDVISNI